MKTRTETVLAVLKYLALLGAIGFSIECGAKLLSLVAAFVNPAWAKNVYHANADWIHIGESHPWFYGFGMTLIVIATAMKATVWYQIFYLLEKLRIRSPFTMNVTRKLERIAVLLFIVWFLIGFIGKTYAYYLLQTTGITTPSFELVDDYFFIAGIVYIISQIFKRGVEIQE